MGKKTYHTYILLSNNDNVIYIGVTGNLKDRIKNHKRKYKKGFTEKYNVNKLVYFEEFDNPIDAIRREKQLKNWHREWKLNLIKSANPALRDLYCDIIDINKGPETSSG